jgi:hypothetical protein
MIEEYISILHNDVWEIIPRLEGKSMIDSKWLYKVNHVDDGNIEKYNTGKGLFLNGFDKKRDSVMMRHLH